MTWLDLTALLNAVCAALLGGLAIAYAQFVWTHGNGFRRFMRWAAPLWAMAAFYHAAIWTLKAFDPTIDTLHWMRPASWLLLAIPAIVLFGSLREDTRHKQIEQARMARLSATIEGMRNGKP